MSKFIFSSPRKYVQGSGVLDELGDYLPALGGKSFLIADDVVWGIIGERVQTSLKKANVAFHYERFNGEASASDITRLARDRRCGG